MKRFNSLFSFSDLAGLNKSLKILTSIPIDHHNRMVNMNAQAKSLNILLTWATGT